MKNYFRKTILLLGDALGFYLALYLALWARYWSLPAAELWQKHLIPFTAICLIWLGVFYVFSFYNLQKAKFNAFFYQALARAVVVASTLSVIFFYIAKPTNITPKRNLLIFIFFYIIILLAWRKIADRLFIKYFPKIKIAIIGANKEASSLIKELREKNYLGYEISFLTDPAHEYPGEQMDGVPIIKELSDLKNKIIEAGVTMIIMTGMTGANNELRAELFKLIPHKISFVKMARFYENITGKVPVGAIDKMWFLENLNEGNKKFFDDFKRIYDLILSLLLLAITIVFWPLVALIIKLESKGPVFITMHRLGKNNKIFKMYKFRSMREENNQRTLTVENDPRITRFGSLIRKTRVDEIPQILNILKGDMSFVGPRPERPEMAVQLAEQIPFLSERTLVKPGITGWDQISGKYHSPTPEDTLEKIQYDLFYIKNRSIYLDLSIILKTMATVLLKQGR